MDLGLVGVDNAIELELDMVRPLEGVGVTGEGDALVLDVQLELILGDVGNDNGDVDEVLLGVGGGRALGPGD